MYTILSSKERPLVKSAKIMSWKDQLLGQVGASVGSAANYYIGKATGANQGIANDQIEQQKKLTSIQEGANARAARNSQELQKEMIEFTNPSMTMKRLEDAGLNPALMYGQGGTGGTTTGSAAQSGVAGGTASDEASRKMTSIQQQGMALQMAKLQSEIDVNKSVAEVNKANAGLSGAKMTTEETQRQSLVEKLTQEGIGKYLENVSQHWKITGDKDSGLDYSGSGKGLYAVMSEKGFIGQEAVNLITKGLADIGNTNAQALLTNKKAEGYFQELMNETAKANAAGIQAAAMKLANEWNTGEFTNWKTWAELGVEAVNTLSTVVSRGVAGKAAMKKAAKPAGAKVTH